MSATHAVKLWLSNVEADYRAVTSMARDCLQIACDNESHARTARNDAVEALASDIQDYICADMPCCKGLWGDIVSSGLAGIDFEEVAKDFVDDEEIWSVFSSDAEDAVLFLSKEEAREHLAGLLDGDNTMHAGAFLAIEKLEDGGKVDIDGVNYCLVRQ